jgi:hypothetical protein
MSCNLFHTFTLTNGRELVVIYHDIPLSFMFRCDFKLYFDNFQELQKVTKSTSPLAVEKV